jgi:hypothetical protein
MPTRRSRVNLAIGVCLCLVLEQHLAEVSLEHEAELADALQWFEEAHAHAEEWRPRYEKGKGTPSWHSMACLTASSSASTFCFMRVSHRVILR